MTEHDDDRTRIRPPSAAPMPPAAPGPQATPAADAPPPASTAGDHGNDLPVGTRLGEFEITRLLGEGGFGIVYLATDHSLQRAVALKEYMPSALAARVGQSQVQVRSARHRDTFDAGLKSFVNEARLLAQFDHPSLLKVHRFWEANGTAYMVMPYYEGITLRDLLRQLPQPPDEPWLRGMLAPLCEALSVIHAEQCYHRDIAPDNVMMLGGSHTRPLLLDFGAARRVIGDMTQALTVILKPGYAPVEQYAEVPGMKQGPWTDVYALAAVLHFAITGRTPPPSVGRLLNDDYEPLAQRMAGRYSEQFLAAIDRALAVRPEDRTQTVAAFGADLGLGQARFDIYSTRPLPPGAEDAPPPAPAASRTAAPAASAPEPTRPPAQPAPATARAGPPLAIWAGGGLVVLAALGFGAYRWLAPAPVAEPTTAPGAPATAAATTPTATPASPPPAAPPVPARLDVPTEFERVVRAQTPGFDVRAQAGKPVLTIGRDLLNFTVQSSREGYLYVLAHGSDDSLIQLYPNTESGAMRLRARQPVSLPKSPIVFEVTEPPGPGQLLFIVSAQQRDLSELDPRAEGAFRSFPTGADAAKIAARHAGPGALLAGRAVCPNGQACADEYGAAVVTVESVLATPR